MVDGINLYRYARNNLVGFLDLQGTDSKVTPNDPRVKAYEQRVHQVRGHLQRVHSGNAKFQSFHTGGAGGGKGPTAPPGGAGTPAPGSSGVAAPEATETKGGSQSQSTTLDKLTALAGLTNFASTDKDGVLGGIPGGLGPQENADPATQAAYVAMSAYNLISLVKAGISAF